MARTRRETIRTDLLSLIARRFFEPEGNRTDSDIAIDIRQAIDEAPRSDFDPDDLIASK